MNTRTNFKQMQNLSIWGEGMNFQLMEGHTQEAEPTLIFRPSLSRPLSPAMRQESQFQKSKAC